MHRNTRTQTIDMHKAHHAHATCTSHIHSVVEQDSQRKRISPWFCGVGTLMKGLVEAKSVWKPLHWESTSKDVGTEQVLAGVTTIKGLNRPERTIIIINNPNSMCP